MTLKLRAASYVFAIASLLPLTARGQTLTDQQVNAINAAVGSYLRPSFTTGPVAFETRVKMQHVWTESRSASRLAAMAQALGATPVHQDTVFVCSGNVPSDCTLRGFQTLLSFSDPQIAGDTVKIEMQRRDRTGMKRIPTARKDAQIRLMYQNGTWRVVDMVIHGMS